MRTWWRRALVGAALGCLASGCAPVRRVGGPAAPDLRPVRSARAAGRPAGGGVCYRAPVAAPVADPFRPPTTRFGPGNRGITYRTPPGTTVWAAAPGVVRFAGPVARRNHVTIEHADGLRTTYSYLASVAVRAGQRLAGRDRVGTAGPSLHVGVLRGGAYLDPARIWGRGCPGRRARLVPLDGHAPGT